LVSRKKNLTLRLLRCCTSTGRIIALGLASGMRAKQILYFNENEGPSIFKGNPLLKTLRKIGWEKYSQKPLEDVLTNCFGTKKVGDCKTRVMIPS
jgi:patatin-like phospholipase/acyl hydrolase